MKKLTLLILLAFLNAGYCDSSPDPYVINIEKALSYAKSDPTLALNSDPSFLPKIKEILMEIREKEKSYPDYIQCLTAQDSFFYAYQVIAKELWHKMGGAERKDFEYLRFPLQKLLQTKDQFFAQYPTFDSTHCFESSIERILLCELAMEEKAKRHYGIFEETDPKVNDFLLLEEKQKKDETDSTIPKFIDDRDAEIGRELISVSFTMESFFPGASCMSVFLSGQSISLFAVAKNEEAYRQKLVAILAELFNHLPLNPVIISDTVDKLFLHRPRCCYGIINQIFIQREHVENIVYWAFLGGLLHPTRNTNFLESYDELLRHRANPPFRTFKNYTGRIIAGGLFKDPDIKIFRYTLIDEEERMAYECYVRNVINSLY
jgi:hypothetical protein